MRCRLKSGFGSKLRSMFRLFFLSLLELGCGVGVRARKIAAANAVWIERALAGGMLMPPCGLAPLAGGMLMSSVRAGSAHHVSAHRAWGHAGNPAALRNAQLGGAGSSHAHVFGTGAAGRSALGLLLLHGKQLSSRSRPQELWSIPAARRPRKMPASFWRRLMAQLPAGFQLIRFSCACDLRTAAIGRAASGNLLQFALQRVARNRGRSRVELNLYRRSPVDENKIRKARTFFMAI